MLTTIRAINKFFHVQWVKSSIEHLVVEPAKSQFMHIIFKDADKKTRSVSISARNRQEFIHFEVKTDFNYCAAH